MKTDQLFYELFRFSPEILLELVRLDIPSVDPGIPQPAGEMRPDRMPEKRRNRRHTAGCVETLGASG